MYNIYLLISTISIFSNITICIPKPFMLGSFHTFMHIHTRENDKSMLLIFGIFKHMLGYNLYLKIISICLLNNWFPIPMKRRLDMWKWVFKISKTNHNSKLYFNHETKEEVYLTLQCEWSFRNLTCFLQSITPCTYLTQFLKVEHTKLCLLWKIFVFSIEPLDCS